MDSFKSAKDTKSAKEFEELKGLVEELETETARPYAPDAPAPFKQELRGQLLQAHEKRGLSRGEMGRLWRFAGTAVALLLLVVAVGLFWAAISGGGTAVGPAADTVIVATRTAVPEMTPTPVPMSQTFVESDVVNASNSPANVIFGDGIRLEEYEIEEQESGFQLTLGWQNQARFEYLFAQLRNEDGELVHQVDVPPTEGEPDIILLEIMPDTEDRLPHGRYDIIIGLYDPTTGQRLRVTAGNEHMVVDGGTAVSLTDWEFTNELTDHVWIITTTQKARPSATSRVEIEVIMGYELATNEEVLLKLHYAAPNWESVTGGRMPIDGMSDYIPLNPEENSVTITFTGNPTEMAQIVGTSQPALVVQLAYFAEGMNGRELKILDMQTYPNALDLSSLDEVRYEVIP